MISGHRRMRAAEIAGLTTIPAVIRDLSDDEATIMTVDSNIQREELFPSKKAFAYRMKMDAMRHQGKQKDETSGRDVDKLNTAEVIGEASGESGREVRRYIHLTYLIPDLLRMVDEQKITITS